MTAIKICGIKNEEHALAAAKAGADFIGMVFAESPRQVTPADAERIVAALKQSGAKAETVGVFVNMPAADVNQIADACGLDWVQISSIAPLSYCLELTRPVIKVIKVSHEFSPVSVIDYLFYDKKNMGERQHMILLDTGDSEKYGGTGQTFEWNLARPVAENFPIIIAGGLTPENVGQAIKIIKPWGVDVSTGVETEGIKDMKKIVAFINAVRKADAEPTG
jgi:phosphoribosylanthranilate isomerase